MLKGIPKINQNLTDVTLKEIMTITQNHSEYQSAKIIASHYLGAKKTGKNQVCFGFWIPDLSTDSLNIESNQIRLEIFSPIDPIQLSDLKKINNMS